MTVKFEIGITLYNRNCLRGAYNKYYILPKECKVNKKDIPVNNL